MRTRFHPLLLLLGPCTALAQQVEVSRYDVDQGLPQSMVNHVVQDRDGFIWLGTGDGLARFDGQRFVVHKHDGRDSTSLSNNRIWGLAVADANHLWVGTRSGLDRLDTRTGRFTHMRIGEPDGCWKPLLVNAEQALFYSPLLREFLRIDGEGAQRWRSPHNGSYVMRVEDEGRTVVQFNRFDTLSISHPPDRSSTSTVLVMDTASEPTALIRQDTGWLLLGQHFSYRLDASLRPVPLPADLHQLLQDHPGKKLIERAPDSTLWLGISGYGVVTLNEALEVTMRYPLLPPEQRPLNITVIAFDRQGNTWVGTDGKGVFTIAPQRIKFGRAMPGQALSWEPRSWFTRGFAQWDEHRVLVSFHQGGLALFDERTGTLAPIPVDALRADTDHGVPMRDRDGRLWVQEGVTIRCIDPLTERVVFRYTATCGDRMMRLASGELLRISTCHPPELLVHSGGAVRFSTRPNAAVFQAIKEQLNMPRVIEQDGQGRFWMCSDAFPISIWNDTERIPSPFDRTVDPQQLMRMTSLVPDGEWIRLTSNDGLFQLDAKDLRIIHHHTVHDGLPDQFLYGMQKAGDGTWWISTNKGLSHFDPGTSTFRNYTTADGLQSKEFNSNAFFRSASGRMYFGGVNGFNHFVPQAIQDDSDTALVQVVALRSGNDTLVLPRTMVELPYPRNTMRIELAVLEFSAPERNTYRWRMIGYRDAWTTAAATMPIELNNVPAGEFMLEVIGINGDGVEGLMKTVLEIHVDRPFWANSWFIVIVVVVVFGSIAWFWMMAYRKRMRTRLRMAEAEMKELRMRTRLAKDIHDDVGSGLARVAALSRSPKRVSDADERFEKVGDISTELLDNLRDVVWMNDPQNGRLDHLLVRIRAFANDLFENEEVQLVFDFPEPLPDRGIGGSFRRNLYLIAREALHNAKKYSGAQRITVGWRIDDEGFAFNVSDNGGGITTTVPQGGGHGTVNMRERAEEIHATYAREPAPNGGTEVRVFGRPSCLDE
ncbi:MAG: hypothetical protein IPP83_03230 [Flavobacteriales bacterium]|nr:hypothetical protein [Flavobacteriales bacterium]